MSSPGEQVRVVCARGEWHKAGRPRVLATFVRDDDPVTADYRDPGTGRGWRALRDGGTDPYQWVAPGGARARLP